MTDLKRAGRRCEPGRATSEIYLASYANGPARLDMSIFHVMLPSNKDLVHHGLISYR